MQLVLSEGFQKRWAGKQNKGITIMNNIEMFIII
jgi:hypothetical protein